MKKTQRMRWSLWTMLLILCASMDASGQVTAEDLTPKSYDRWLKFIQPNKKERLFEKVGWRNQFWPAVQEAKRLGRPILLWTMNGHPLGCT